MFTKQTKPINWPFPVPGQIKRIHTENERIKVENRQVSRDKQEAVKELGDALF
jgi:hypothetical protein